MIKITWKTTEDITGFEGENAYQLHEKKSWKGNLIRGYDVAEMIAEDIWTVTENVVTEIEILSPAAYAGRYTIKAKMEPTFSAKRVDNVV